MREAAVDAPPVITWGVATRALAGEQESGDLHLVKQVGRGVLVAAVDGLGHGAEAAAAARAAVAALDRYAEESLLPLVRRCHEALVGSRGVVMSLAYFGGVQPSLTWLGVGNVEGVVVYAAPHRRPARASLVTRGGIIGGAELPQLRTNAVPVAPGDLLIFATDGIRDGFSEGLPADATPQELADDILARFGKGTDDALVLVARYAGGGPARA
jgi:negative regulator of sigma-B (phosphoserine phosphatase)